MRSAGWLRQRRGCAARTAIRSARRRWSEGATRCGPPPSTGVSRGGAMAGDVRRQVQDGCLTRELRFVGLRVGDAPAAAPPRSAPKPSQKGTPKKDAEAAEREAEAG